MLTFDAIVGQPATIEALRGLVASGRVPHAFLFHGPQGVGKATTAAALAATLICERGATAPCGGCASCALLDVGSHPDLLRVGRLTRKEIEKDERSRLSSEHPDAPEEDLGSQILVDQIRSINALVGLRPRQGRRRVILIDPADRMNREAQNGLLKTLEEPPAHSLLVLVASRPHLLLPTVRSRCFALGFSAMGARELAALLERRGIGAAEAGARAALAGGSLGVAIALDLAARRGRREEIREALEALTAQPAALDRLPALAAALAGQDEATLLDGLALVQELVRDAARAGPLGDCERLVHADLAEPLARLGHRLGLERAIALVGSVERLRGDLRYNVNRTLIAEALLAGVAGGPVP